MLLCLTDFVEDDMTLLKDLFFRYAVKQYIEKYQHELMGKVTQENSMQ